MTRLYRPNSYRKSVHYPPIVSYHPRTYYVDDSGFDDQWSEGLPSYLTYETLPRIQKKPVYFAPPTTEKPATSGYHYPAPETEYLPPSKEPIPFAPIQKKRVSFAFPTTEQPATDGYHYPAPETKYLPPSKEPIPFAPSKKPDVPKTVYLPPKTVYLPPTRKPTTATPKTTIRTTTTTLKPSTPKSLYLPPIVVPEPTIVGEYLPPSELSHHLQPPPVSAARPILFN